jgi:hypothetical protein
MHCSGGFSRTQNMDDEMVFANEIIDWYIDFPTARDRCFYYEDDASDISEESEDEEAYSYLLSYGN